MAHEQTGSIVVQTVAKNNTALSRARSVTMTAMLLLSIDSHASSSPDAEAESPWLVVPTISSDPKVGTSAGMIAGYLFKLDPDSTASMVGLGGTYSTTDSSIAALFMRGYGDGDSKRLTVAAATGKIKNDYEDFLGSGLPLSDTDNLKLYFARYMQSVSGPWFVGLQGIYTNYLITGDDFRSTEILQALGLTGFDSVGLGAILAYDDRDNQNAPLSGSHLLLHNFAYRESFGGEDSFDTLRLEWTQYLSTGDDDVFAYRLSGRWTSDAPNSGYSSLDLRAYTRGQYLAPHSVTVEVEQRWQLRNRLGLNLFAGVACLYGDGEQCDSKKNLYPSAGIGLQYVIKPRERIVITTDYAQGKNGNHGFYVRFGQAF